MPRDPPRGKMAPVKHPKVTQMTSVSIVEDNSRLRRAITAVLTMSGKCGVVATYASAEAALARLSRDEVPEVILMDLNLPGADGTQCTAQIKALHPEVQVLILTVYEDTDAIFGALQAGASGYILKRAHPDELLQAIQDVKTGGSPMTSEIARKVVKSFQKLHPDPRPAAANLGLTSREQETLNHLARGFVAKEIADRMGVSVNTIRFNLKHIYEKLHVHSQTEAVIKFLGKPPAG